MISKKILIEVSFVCQTDVKLYSWCQILGLGRRGRVINPRKPIDSSGILSHWALNLSLCSK